ncbi:MAG: sulfatase-like hydrolase/transferase [Acidobacteria bacterium]|nr:sulfatase-like hydrolase/transferase [Acidobacteriota bacterium]
MAITRRSAITTLMGASVLPAQRRKPNFVILLADDLGYGDISCFGSPDVHTPNIDSIGRDGVRFTDGYVTAALCSPSRAGLLTGRYQQRFGHEFNPSGGRDRSPEVGLPLGETTVPERLKRLGYHTCAIGKWHLGGTPKYHPLERGFDEYFGFLFGANLYYNASTPGDKRLISTEEAATAALEQSGQQLPLYRGREQVEEKAYLTEAFGREAVSFIGRRQNDPFFLYVAFNAVHTPLMATGKYLDRFINIKDERHRMLAAMTSAMDDAVGAILGKLRDTGLEKDTIVFFLSDNGCPTRFRAGSNGPLNGSKATYYEGGIRVPFLMKWPGRIRSRMTYRQPVSSLDVLPTLLPAAGAGLPKPPEIDGVDLMTALGPESSAAPDDNLFWRAGRIGAVRRGDWKLLDLAEQGVRLYNLASDLGEKKNLAADRPDIVKQLREAHQTWNAQMVKPRWDARQFTIPVNGEAIRWDG